MTGLLMLKQTRSNEDIVLTADTISPQIEKLTVACSFWNTWYMLFFALTAIATFACVFGTYFVNKRANELNAAKDELLRLKDEQNKVQIAKVQSEARKYTADVEAATKLQIEKTRAEADVKISDAKAGAAKANERAAQAEEKAAEAKLALEKYKAPRILTSEGQARVASKMASYSGQAFDFAATTSKESLNLVEQIESTLVSAKWMPLEWTGGTISRNGKPMLGHAIETGITVQVEIEQQENLLGIAKALSSALKDEGIAAEAQLMPVPRTDNHNAIHIVVGDKPR